MSNQENDSPQVSHVAIKAPTFYKRAPQVWFKQMESQFMLANITKTETKFHHILSALPEEVAVNIDLDCGGNYDQLKENVLSSLKPNQHELIDQALRGLELGEKRPTQMVGEIRRRFQDIGLEAEEKIVKSQILAAMPHTIRSALVGHENASLDEFSKIADSMLSITNSQSSNPFLVGALSQPNSSQFRAFEGGRGGGWRGEIHKQANYDNRNTNFKINDNKFSVRPFFSGQRPRVCNAHIFYGERARTCRHWCKWPNKPQHMLKDYEKTPRHSRSNSPAAPRDTLNE